MKKINYMVLFALSTLLLACSSDVKIDKLIGQWKVSDMKVDLPHTDSLMFEVDGIWTPVKMELF
jgi:outer membrane murein-binding lipoprotein Lpp